MNIYILEVKFETEDEEWTTLSVHKSRKGARKAQDKDEKRVRALGYTPLDHEYNVQEHNLRK